MFFTFGFSGIRSVGGGSAGAPAPRNELGGERDIQVLAGLGIIRLESQGFLELADRLVGSAFLGEGDAEVVVGLGVIRFQAEGFLELADGLVDLAFLAEGDAEVVVGLGVIRFQAEGFLELADRLVAFGLSCRGRCRGCCGRRRNPVSGGGLPGIGGSPRRIWPFLSRASAEVVVGVGVIRFQADGFLELADRLVDLAFLVEGECRGCSGPSA